MVVWIHSCYLHFPVNLDQYGSGLACLGTSSINHMMSKKPAGMPPLQKKSYRVTNKFCSTEFLLVVPLQRVTQDTILIDVCLSSSTRARTRYLQPSGAARLVCVSCYLQSRVHQVTRNFCRTVLQEYWVHSHPQQSLSVGRARRTRYLSDTSSRAMDNAILIRRLLRDGPGFLSGCNRFI
jgi:hypothetical protein